MKHVKVSALGDRIWFGAVSRAFAHKSNLIVFVVKFGVFLRCSRAATKATPFHLELSYYG